jgi:hypothetical protein
VVNKSSLEPGRIVSAVLSGLNNDISITPYAHGFLISLPLFFYDDDRVKLFVEPHGSGVKVGDRGLTSMRLTMSDVNFSARRVQEALAQSVDGHLLHLDAEGGEISSFGSMGDLPDLVFAVASAVLRVDQIRWLAIERRPVAFRDKVVHELIEVAGQNNRVIPHATISLRSGRKKQVTAAVGPETPTLDAPPLYVQALSGQDSDARESAVARCFHLFSFAVASRDHLIAVASGTRSDWPESLVEEVSQVSTVAFFEERGSVAETVGRKLAAINK